MVGKLSSFVFVVVVVRTLGVERYGWFNFAVSFLPLLLTPAGWGIDVAVLRAIAREPASARHEVATAATLRLALAVAALAIALLGALFLVPNRTAFEVAVLVGVGLLCDEIGSFLGVVFKAQERMALPALTGAANRVVSALLAVTVIAAGGGPVAASGAFAVGSALGAVVLAAATRRHLGGFRLSVGRERMTDLLRMGAPLALAAVLNTAMFRVDTLLLQGLAGATAVGLYGVAYRFLDSLLFISWGLSGAVVPIVARTGASPTVGPLLALTGTIALAIHLPIAVGAPVAAEWAVRALFSERAAAAAAVVPWLTAAGVCYALAYLARATLIALGRRRPVVVVAAIALVTNVAANAYAIPRHGPAGAGAVTLLTQLVEVLLLGHLVRQSVTSLRPTRLTIAVVVAAVAMGGALVISGVRGSGAVILGGGVYLAVLAGLMGTVARGATREAVVLLRRSPSPLANPAAL